MRFKLPLIPGGDFAGVVEEIGFNVKKFEVGHDVFGLTQAVKGGAYAEYVAVNQENLWFKPKNVTFEEAASIPLAGLTAFQGLYYQGQLKQRSHVFINGCTGGVGSFAVQIAKAYDCKVTGTCSSENTDYAKKIGVDYVIAYDISDVSSHNLKYDIFFDVSGTLTYKKVKHLLYNKGIYVSTLPSASLYISKIIHKNVKSFWVNSNLKDLENLQKMTEEKLLIPNLERIYPLQEAVKAHKFCEGSSVNGKVAIKI